jgi:hypothetical protein
MRSRVVVASAILLCLTAAAARADVRDEPVKVRVHDVAGDGTAASPLRARLEIVTTVPAEVENLRLEGEGWSVTSPAAPRRLVPGLAAEAAFTAVALDPAAPLVVRWEVDGLPYEKILDLSPPALARARTPGATTRRLDLDARKSGAAIAPPDVRPSAAPGGPGKPDRVMQDAGRLPRTQARDIRVHGRFVYVRSDGTTLGADGVACRIYDEDSGPDELLATTSTNIAGYYDITFNWDPCFACDSEPDLYVHFEAANTKVEVESATLEINYTWVSYQTDDYTGTDLDIGTLQPSDTAQHPALHLLTDMTRTWRWFEALGLGPPTTDVQWPDGATGAYYNPSFQEIHVSTQHEWREPTHSHEYGHHWQKSFAVLQTPDYCNGICDTGGCGHCLFCRETAGDALDEGWGDWVGDVVPRGYAALYGTATQFSYNFESVQTCQVDATMHDPLLTEGFVAALMRDIEDATQDNDPGVPGAWQDRLAEGPDEIVTVMNEDEPLTVTAFLTAFRARYPGLCDRLWETAKNNGYEIDVQPPGVAGALVSTSHAAPSPDPTADFTWTQAPDDCSGTDAYSVVVAAAAQLPDNTAELGDATAVTTVPLAPGTYFLCLRARDRAGNWAADFASRQFTVSEQPVPVVAAVERVEAAPDRVAVEWQLGGRGEIRSVDVQRRAPASDWTSVATVFPDGAGRLRHEDRDVAGGERYGYRLAIAETEATTFAGETWVDVPRAVLALTAAPLARGVLSVGLTLADDGPATLRVVDVAGRLVAARAVGDLGRGGHDIELLETRAAASGVYFVSLEQGGREVVRRIVLLQ